MNSVFLALISYDGANTAVIRDVSCLPNERMMRKVSKSVSMHTFCRSDEAHGSFNLGHESHQCGCIRADARRKEARPSLCSHWMNTASPTCV
jgi:hypothetical protein